MSTIGKTVGAIFVCNIVIVVSIFVAITCGIIYGYKKINTYGVKGCIERVWTGPTNNVSTNTP